MRIILIGGGKLAYFLSQDFASKGYQLTLITADAAEAQRFSRQLRASVMVGDGSDPALLDQAEAYRADVLLALLPEDQDNLVACQVAKRRYGVEQTVALVNDPNNRELFEKLGISVAFSATEVIANSIQKQTELESIRNLIPVAEGQVSVAEVPLEADSPVLGQSLLDVIPPEGAVVACIVRGGQVFVPRNHTTFELGDRLVVVSQADCYGPLLKQLTGEA